MSRDLTPIYFADDVDEIISHEVMQVEETIELIKEAQLKNEANLDLSLSIALAKKEVLDKIYQEINLADNYRVPVGLPIPDEDLVYHWKSGEEKEYWKRIIEEFNLKELI